MLELLSYGIFMFAFVMCIGLLVKKPTFFTVSFIHLAQMSN